MHPMMSHGVASPMHPAPAQIPALYHHPSYGYYTLPQGYGMAAYESPGLHPSLITSTPTMHASQVPITQRYMYEDPTSPTENEADRSLGVAGGRLVQGQAATVSEMQVFNKNTFSESSIYDNQTKNDSRVAQKTECEDTVKTFYNFSIESEKSWCIL